MAFTYHLMKFSLAPVRLASMTLLSRLGSFSLIGGIIRAGKDSWCILLTCAILERTLIMKTTLKRSLAGVGIALLVLVLGYSLLRLVHLRWGATEADLQRSMPGDLSGSRWTRAILIDATPEQIWPWLVQFGQGRGGWYSYDWLENLLGFEIHTADGLLPAYQDPQVGTPICMSGSFCPSAVHVIEPYRWFGWQATDEAGQPVWTFIFGLFPEGENRTRLVVRESFNPTFMPPAAVLALEIPDVVMELKMLDTLKARAEGRPNSGLVTAFEITLWLAAFVASLGAGWLFITQPEWQRPLVFFVSGLVVLLLITFLFLPLWLRGLLAVGLFVGLTWKKR
jgi:hypothetical protein